MIDDEVKKFVDDMMKETESVLMVDPPSGWRYGFPKPYFKNAVTDENELKMWLLSEGYPQKEIDSCGKMFPVRYWQQRD